MPRRGRGSYKKAQRFSFLRQKESAKAGKFKNIIGNRGVL
jgi:hypothetical protein